MDILRVGIKGRHIIMCLYNWDMGKKKAGPEAPPFLGRKKWDY
jgi:hypothetical protein